MALQVELGRIWAVSVAVFVTAMVTIGDGQGRTAGNVTFASDIAPILFARCGGCHRPQGAAPFSLLTYADARQRARLIAQVAKSRIMPPWKSEPGYGDFIGHRHLTDAEVDRLERWADAGAPQGDPQDLPPIPVWTDGWQLGVPHVTVDFPQPFVVPADGMDFSRIFVLRLPVSKPTYVSGLEFQPGPGGVVHHANIRIDATRRSRDLVERAAEFGYSGLLSPSAVYPDGHFLGWTPGQVAPLLPKGLAWRLNPGTDLVVEIHFVPNGKAQTIQPSVGLYFTADPPDRTPALLRLGRQNIEISAGEPRYVSSDAFVLPVDVDVQAVQPHAHYRAREVRGTATTPDGASIPLIFIKDWDYRWQHVYRYVTPLSLPKGTKVELRYVFDNSADNLRNPHQPPRPVHWGQRSTDEMGDLWVQMLARNERDLRTLKESLEAKHLAEEVVGYEVMIRDDPSSVTLRNDVAVLYTQTGELDKAALHLQEVARLQPESAAARYNFGTALSSLGRVSEAVTQYREALRLRPDYALAHNNLGHGLLSTSRPVEAEHHFREAVRLDPTNASALYNIGMLARARGAVPEAIEQYEQAVRLQPDFVPAVANLAWIRATTPSADFRDVKQALALAERAASLTERRSASVLDVLAAALAAAGDFGRAVSSCDEALALAPGEPLAAAIRQRRTLYSQHRRFVSR